MIIIFIRLNFNKWHNWLYLSIILQNITNAIITNKNGVHYLNEYDCNINTKVIYNVTIATILGIVLQNEKFVGLVNMCI